MKRIALFTRGELRFGTGHLHRSQWLYEMLEAQPGLQGQVDVWCEQTQTADKHFQRCGIDPNWHRDPVGAWLKHQQESSGRGFVCVLDWLDSQPEQVQALRAAGARVVLLDDHGPAQAEADLVINCLLAPLDASEQQLGRARVLSGADYIQLPPQAIRLRGISLALSAAMQTVTHGDNPYAAPRPVRSLLISGGGVECRLDTDFLLRTLAACGYGGQATIMPSANSVASRSTCGRMLVQELPAGPEFHDLLAGADFAILAGGLSLYEACFLGVPTLCLPIVPHQALTARKLASAGCCAALPKRVQDVLMGLSEPKGDELEVLATELGSLLESAERRGRLSASGLSSFDGLGLHRTVSAILELAS